MRIPTILVADDDGSIRTVLQKSLTRSGYNVQATSNATTLWKWVSQGEGDVVVTDVVMPDENAFELLPRIKKSRPDLPVIVMSAQNTMMTAITATEKGAFDYLPKPFDLNELANVVERALKSKQTNVSKDAETLRSVYGENLPLIGRSPAMQEVYRVLARLMTTDLTVMITGESGTGKELVARALHTFGKRRNGPFVAINMAAIPRELIESELFGHEKGAFTGANTRAAGRFEQAHGGTLFLDEIGDMPMEAQTRLLRVLQEGEYSTVGGSQTIKTDVRIIAASNKNLKLLIQRGLFREDLFFRLNVVPLRLPPLRERKQDIPDLSRYFMAQAQEQGLSPKSIDQNAFDALMGYDWPGNVRELENLINRCTAIYSDDVITDQHIRQELVEGAKEDTEQPARQQTLAEAIDSHISEFFGSFSGELPPTGLYDRFLPDLERPLIIHCLNATKGNQVKAAELMGVNRNTLRKKIKDLGIAVDRNHR